MVEMMEGENQYKAEGHGLQDARKGVLFEAFPPVLQLQLKRFEYDFNRDTMVKVRWLGGPGFEGVSGGVRGCRVCGAWACLRAAVGCVWGGGLLSTGTPRPRCFGCAWAGLPGAGWTARGRGFASVAHCVGRQEGM